MKSRIGPFLSVRSWRIADVLDDALLHLLEAEVVLVEAAAHVVDVELVRRRLAPRQVREPLEVGARDVVLGRLLLHAGEARELLARDLLRPRGQLGAANALAQLLDLVVLAGLAELLADGLHLLAEDLLALRSCPRPRPCVVISLHAEDLELALHHREHERARAPWRRTSRAPAACRRRWPARAGGSTRSRSASAPVSRTLSRMPAVSFGRFGMSASTSRVASRRPRPRASSSASRSRSSGMRSTFARMYGSSAGGESISMRARPLSTTV